jgi:UDP-N-acetyl-2-amino-2-deoxyglucuronate dehydrogenase
VPENISKTISFAIVGYGHIGKRHAAMVEQNPETELSAIIDVKSKDELGLADSKTDFYPSLEDLLKASPKIDVVTIATPNGLHATQAIAALKAGYHVVIEKPMALSTVEAEAIIHQSMQSSREVFVVKQNRYSPPSQWIKEIVESKRLGRIFTIQINCFWNRDERYYIPESWHGKIDLDGGTLFTQFSHFIDTLFWLFGDVDILSSTMKDYNHQELTDFEDTGVVVFKTNEGALGTFNFTTSVAEKNFESTLTIIGKNGTVRLGGQYMNEVTYCEVKDYKLPTLATTNAPNDYGLYKGSAANHHFVIQNVVDALKGRKPKTTNGLEGMKVVNIIERMYNVSKA